MKILDQYPVETAEQVKEAGAYFEEHLNRFSPEDRMKIAGGMYTASVYHKQPMEKQASYNKYLNHVINDSVAVKEAELKNAVKCRRDLINSEKAHGTEKTANEQLDNILSFSGDKFTIKIAADMLNSFDLAYGLNRVWDEKLADPWLSVANSERDGAISFDKVANNKYDIIDLHNMSCQVDMVKSANEVIDDSYCDSFLENPFQFVQKTAQNIQTVFFDKMEEFQANA